MALGRRTSCADICTIRTTGALTPRETPHVQPKTHHMSFASCRAFSLRITWRCRHHDVRRARDLRGHPLASRPLWQRRDRTSFAPPSGLRLGVNGLDHPRVRRWLPGDRRSRRRHRHGGGRWTLRKGRRDRRKIRRSRLLNRHDRRRSNGSSDRSHERGWSVTGRWMGTPRPRSRPRRGPPPARESPSATRERA